MARFLAPGFALVLACSATPPPPPRSPPDESPTAVAATARADANATHPTTEPAGSPPASLLPVSSRSSPACGTRPTVIGRVDSPALDEVSGMVASRKSPGVLFVHNDSGDSARFFALDRAGHLLAEVSYAAPFVLDVEELALGPAPQGGSFLYLADTGNNFARSGRGIPRGSVSLYRVAEPEVSLSARGAKLTANAPLRIELRFPESAHDVEAFFVDPRSGDAFLITKEDDGASLVLRAPAAELDAGKVMLQPAGRLAFGTLSLPGNKMPTAADVSEDGSQLLVRTYSSVFLFERRPGESVNAALARTPRQLASPAEQQGEAITFVPGEPAFLTLSEGMLQPIYCVAF